MKKLLLALIVIGFMASPAWGETKTAWIDGTLRNPITQKVIEINDYMRIYKHQVNLASSTLDAGDADVGEVVLLPQNCIVLKAWVRVVTACPTNSTVDLGYGSDVDYWGNALPLDATGIVATALTASETWDPGSIDDGNEEAEEVTVTSAASGDVVQFSFTNDLEDLALVGDFSYPNVVTAVLGNWTGGSIDVNSGTLAAYVDKAPLAAAPVLLTSSDTIDIKATVDAGDVDIITGVIEVNVLVMSTAASGFPQ